MTSRRIAIILACFLLAALPALAANPNFSGNWKLNASKSQFGEMPAPSAMTAKITHDDPKLESAFHQSSDMGDFDMNSKYTTDGKECANEGFGGGQTKSVLKWDGATLVIDTKGQFGDNEFNMQDKWSLSEDGKTLTIVLTFKSAMGEGSQKLVLEKQ